MFITKLLVFVLSIHNISNTFCFQTCMAMNNRPHTHMSRRDISKALMIGSLVLLQRPSLSFALDEENRPLTPEEMEEYNRLLKEAEKIKSIIKANKDALINNDEENGIEIYLKKNNITKSK